MDVGKFKTSRVKLILWALIPPLIVVGVGLSSYALRQQSEWQLERTQVLAEILPELSQAKLHAQDLMVEFRKKEEVSIRTADEYISFLQNAAARVGFTVDTLKVDRRVSVVNGNMPVLVASIKGMGEYLAVESFVGDVTSKQHLLSASSLKISESNRLDDHNTCMADITFNLFLFDTSALEVGGAK